MNKKYRRAVIAGNWKMNKSASELPFFAEELKALIKRDKRVAAVICPGFTAIPAAVKALKALRIHVGAQNMHEEPAGAYTGEVSAAQLRDVGADFVILGHSERRQHFNETDEAVNRKVRSALAAGLTPIVCIGESLSERERGVTFERAALQLRSALSGLGGAEAKRVVIAYEPVWAIGTGVTATSEQAGEVCTFIRVALRESFGWRVARAVSVLYGGSMNAKNVREFISEPDIDGGLIGGASLTVADFAAIYAAACED